MKMPTVGAPGITVSQSGYARSHKQKTYLRVLFSLGTSPENTTGKQELPVSLGASSPGRIVTHLHICTVVCFHRHPHD